MKSSNWLMIPAIIIPAAISAPAFAVQYLSVEQAQKTLFPEASHFVPADITFTPEMKQQIEKSSGVRVRNQAQQVWRVETNNKTIGWFVLDEVIGKHEFITYAVALSADGTVKGIDILDYRETHGGEIKNAKWRAQFTGKKNGDALRLDDDIKNISGATLSCKNITNGVKRILATYQVALK
ncbi:FMN-binding protein [Sulfurirhabdus autotrophica]|uniref:FMN-binding protein n=1 Tax=Sulfurirhabdus autotrophica TaxID=1706046 RepID=A0A4V2W2R5_9PROT|nr:FMN-binding protein [Sulfurirhabdus autotrophica]TCV89049.1 FMN-binding protein [Sulfurirhabdus autotrophica]